jgi:hypothetical protein
MEGLCARIVAGVLERSLRVLGKSFLALGLLRVWQVLKKTALLGVAGKFVVSVVVEFDFGFFGGWFETALERYFLVSVF